MKIENPWLWLVFWGVWLTGVAQDRFLAESDIPANPTASAKSRFQFDYELRLTVETRGKNIPLTVYANSADGSVGLEAETLRPLVAAVSRSPNRDFTPQFGVWLTNQKPAVYGDLRNTGKVVFSADAHPVADVAFVEKYWSVMQFLNAERANLRQPVRETRTFAGVSCSYYEVTTPDRFVVKAWMAPTDIVSQAPHWNSLVGVLKNYHQRQNLLVGQYTVESQTDPRDQFTVTLKYIAKLTARKSLDGTAYESVLSPTQLNETHDYQTIINERRDAEMRLKQMQENCRTLRSNSPEKKRCLEEYRREKEQVEQHFKQKYPAIFRE